jgi:ankyrin repeat protein
MKTTFGGLILVILILAAANLARAQTNDLASLLQQGLLEEQANRNLDAAIADYSALAAQFDKNRQLAATAIFRLGECYRMQNKTNEAAAQYQRILKDFSDQQTLATLSRQNLAGMGMSESPTTSSARQRQIELLEKQITLAQQNVAAVQKRFQVGQATQTEVNAAEQQAIQLQITLAGLNASPAATPVSTQSQTSSLEEQSEIQRILTMIQNSPDLINAPGKDGNTPLTAAAAAGQLKVAAYLLDHGADVNAGENPALNAAVVAGNRAMVEFLLSRGANVNSKSLGVEDTPLHTAARKGFEAVAKVLLANKADVNAQNKSGWTPLMCAASANQPEIVKLLLAAGTNPNLKGDRGETALNCAIGNSPEMFQMLLAAKADPNTIDSSGRTPLSYAAGKDGAKVVKWLLDAKANPNGGTLTAPLLAAIHAKDTHSVELLLQAGANPNAKGKVSWSGNVFFMNGGQPTPLWLAISEKQLPMVQLLLKYKANPNDSQTDGRSLLFSALGDTNILEALLDAGANIESHDETANINGDLPDWTPLTAATWQKNVAAVDVLLKHGADPNQRDKTGGVALHWAVSFLWVQLADDNRQIVELLLAHGANPNVRNNSGFTPLDWVKNKLNDQHQSDKAIAVGIADLLRQHGALDKLPDWNAITVSRPSANFSEVVFQKGTNDWNQFTLLETIFNFYSPLGFSARTFAERLKALQNANSKMKLSFPDFAHVVIVRPSHDSTNETRIEVNLLNGTNGIDVSKDVPLEFGDVVEISELDHALGARPVGLTDGQRETLFSLFKGNVRLAVHGQTIEIPIYHCFDSGVHAVLGQSEARNLLLASSDLSRVKVIRRDPKTGKSQEWILDCRPPESSANNMPIIAYQWNNTPPSTDLRLRDGDVIEVPEKP